MVTAHQQVVSSGEQQARPKCRNICSWSHLCLPGLLNPMVLLHAPIPSLSSNTSDPGTTSLSDARLEEEKELEVALFSVFSILYLPVYTLLHSLTG